MNGVERYNRRQLGKNECADMAAGGRPLRLELRLGQRCRKSTRGGVTMDESLTRGFADILYH